MKAGRVAAGTESDLGDTARGFGARLKVAAYTFKREFATYRLVLRDPRTPWPAKVLLGLAIGYALMPFDLVPDAIPVIGHLDDLVIVPLLIIAARKLVPAEIIEECRQRVVVSQGGPQPKDS